MDAEQREELEAMIRDLEEENSTLQAEYDRLKLKQTPSATPDDSQNNQLQSSGNSGGQDMMAEAKLLRQHKGRLEARMQILEDHNRQLEAQLQRLRQLLDEVCLNHTNINKIKNYKQFLILILAKCYKTINITNKISYSVTVEYRITS